MNTAIEQQANKHAVHFSSDSSVWETPPEVFDPLDAEFYFTLDVCASDLNHKVDRYFTGAQDGLAQSWKGEVCWCNPPYGRGVARWITRAWLAAREEGATVVCLLPARTDTVAWHNYIWDGEKHQPREGVEIRFVKGRIKFVGALAGAPFPSAIVIFRPVAP